MDTVIATFLEHLDNTLCSHFQGIDQINAEYHGKFENTLKDQQQQQHQHANYQEGAKKEVQEQERQQQLQPVQPVKRLKKPVKRRQSRSTTSLAPTPITTSRPGTSDLDRRCSNAHP